MKLSLIFITLSLISATALTATHLNPDTHKATPTSKDVLAVYADLVNNTCTIANWGVFCTFLALHFPILVEKDYALDAELL